MQCRGQIDGAIAMGIGWALYEKMVYDANGAMVNPALRDYRIPAFADLPRSEVHFADTYDKVGPLGAKAQGECAINAVAPAIANAVANATGIRFTDLPLTPDRILNRLAQHSGLSLRHRKQSHAIRSRPHAAGLPSTTESRSQPSSPPGARRRCLLGVSLRLPRGSASRAPFPEAALKST